MWTALILLVLGVAAFAVWVRVAPTDVARWHKMPAALEPGDMSNGAVRTVDASEGTLAAFDRVVGQTPRTQRIAGSVDDGMITYVTRSAAFGFPDYTTVQVENDQLVVFGRARFGLSDLGVNATRIDGWLAALGRGG